MDEPSKPPGPPKPKGKFWLRILLYSVMILALAAVVVPNYMKSRETACLNSCINNLRQLDGAKEQWGLENKAERGALAPDAEVDIYIKGGRPKCPGGGTYFYNKMGEVPKCSMAGHTL